MCESFKKEERESNKMQEIAFARAKVFYLLFQPAANFIKYDRVCPNCTLLPQLSVVGSLLLDSFVADAIATFTSFSFGTLKYQMLSFLC